VAAVPSGLSPTPLIKLLKITVGIILHFGKLVIPYPQENPRPVDVSNYHEL
jgi:hypothetical protein